MDEDYLRFNEKFYYRPETGEVIWKVRPENNSHDKRCNTTHAGKPLSYKTDGGYIRVNLHGSVYYAHRIAWLLYTGRWPRYEIDHINGDRSDNRIENLREVNSSGNSKNLGMRYDNSSGYNGVYKHPSWKDKWVTYLKMNGKNTYLGGFNSAEAAYEYRRKVEKENGYHENHGRKNLQP